MIGSMLRLARLESGSEALEGAPVVLDRMVQEVAADADFEAKARNRRVRVTQTDGCTIRGNRQLLRSAVENVTRNAVAYTAEGTEVQIALKLLSSNGNGTVLENQRARLRKRSAGGGRGNRSLLPVYRVGDARDRFSGGSGLGLSITERAVRLHGGTVKAENCKDGGLLVEIRLPMAAK